MLVALAAAGAACTKSEGTGGTAPNASETAQTAGSAAPALSLDASASNTGDAGVAMGGDAAAAQTDAATPADTRTTTAVATGSKDASAAPSGSAAPAECGTKPLPDCPLQAWMKANTTPYVAEGNLPALATALDKIVEFAPPGAGYPNWVSISKDGARAARAGEMSAAKASCRSCHDQYKQKYKTEIRGRKI